MLHLYVISLHAIFFILGLKIINTLAFASFCCYTKSRLVGYITGFRLVIHQLFLLSQVLQSTSGSGFRCITVEGVFCAKLRTDPVRRLEHVGASWVTFRYLGQVKVV